MIRVKPDVDYSSRCPYCQTQMQGGDVLWQGIHVCVRATCDNCRSSIIEDLPIGHAIDGPYQVDLATNRLFGPEKRRQWFGEPLLRSLRSPSTDPVGFQVARRSKAKSLIVVNCLDFLYGHSLLKLFNLERHLRNRNGLALGVLIPKSLEWMVPNSVEEVWVVDLPFTKIAGFYPDLQRHIQDQVGRFDTLFVSRAYSHPKVFDISVFAGVNGHDFAKSDFRISYAWRDDRLWHGRWALLLGRAGLSTLLVRWQRHKITSLFKKLRRSFPEATFTVVGLGTLGRFPDWIEDCRTERYDSETERRHCQIYSESRLVIGVHGSNMLLPSGLSGLTMDLMPDDRWGNLAQDIVYQEPDSRMASFRYRFLPIGTGSRSLAITALSQLRGFEAFKRHMVTLSE